MNSQVRASAVRESHKITTTTTAAAAPVNRVAATGSGGDCRAADATEEGKTEGSVPPGGESFTTVKASVRAAQLFPKPAAAVAFTVVEETARGAMAVAEDKDVPVLEPELKSWNLQLRPVHNSSKQTSNCCCDSRMQAQQPKQATQSCQQLQPTWEQGQLHKARQPHPVHEQQFLGNEKHRQSATKKQTQGGESAQAPQLFAPTNQENVRERPHENPVVGDGKRRPENALDASRETGKLPTPQSLRYLHEAKHQHQMMNYVPVYPTVPGVPAKLLRAGIAQILSEGTLVDSLPLFLRVKRCLGDLDGSLRALHFPTSLHAMHAAKRRLFYTFMLWLQLGKMLRRNEMERAFSGYSSRGGDAALARFVSALPFTLTTSQHEAIDAIKKDMEASYPMRRLLQGDVGSGKTVVAAAALLLAAAAGHQAALLAPTGALAKQHQINLEQFLKPLGHRVYLLTGNAVDKEATVDAINSGVAAVTVGTHALLQDYVKFPRLGLVVVDEQQKFGVNQRWKLLLRQHGSATKPQIGARRARKVVATDAAAGVECTTASAITDASSSTAAKANDFADGGRIADVLLMTATPIPRTQVLLQYGDLQLSQLKHKNIRQALPQTKAPLVQHSKDIAYTAVAEDLVSGANSTLVCAATGDAVAPPPSLCENISELSPSKSVIGSSSESSSTNSENSSDSSAATERRYSSSHISDSPAAGPRLTNRNLVQTKLIDKIDEKQVAFVLHVLRREIAKGRQAFWICPLVDGSSSPHIPDLQHEGTIDSENKVSSNNCTDSGSCDDSSRETGGKGKVEMRTRRRKGLAQAAQDRSEPLDACRLMKDDKLKSSDMQGDSARMRTQKDPVDAKMTLLARRANTSSTKEETLLLLQDKSKSDSPTASSPPSSGCATAEADVSASLTSSSTGASVEMNLESAAVQKYEELKRQLPDIRVKLLHGRMKAEEKEKVLKELRAKEIDLLVATTVVEVGIDVPNASVIVIDNAERFGLTQLHQLRGRVGRDQRHASFCFLLLGKRKVWEEKTMRRFVAIASTTDGFEVAARDTQLRGGGTLFGKHQHGQSDLRMLRGLKQSEQQQLLEQAAEDAVLLLQRRDQLKQKAQGQQEQLKFQMRQQQALQEGQGKHLALQQQDVQNQREQANPHQNFQQQVQYTQRDIQSVGEPDSPEPFKAVNLLTSSADSDWCGKLPCHNESAHAPTSKSHSAVHESYRPAESNHENNYGELAGESAIRYVKGEAAVSKQLAEQNGASLHQCGSERESAVAALWKDGGKGNAVAAELLRVEEDENVSLLLEEVRSLIPSNKLDWLFRV